MRMSADEFYEKYYSKSGIPKPLVLELLQEIANAVEIPSQLLRPQDGFLIELADLRGEERMDGGLAELTFAAQRRLKQAGANVDLSAIRTVDDYIHTMGSLLRAPSEHGSATQ